MLLLGDELNCWYMSQRYVHGQYQTIKHSSTHCLFSYVCAVMSVFSSVGICPAKHIHAVGECTYLHSMVCIFKIDAEIQNAFPICIHGAASLQTGKLLPRIRRFLLNMRKAFSKECWLCTYLQVSEKRFRITASILKTRNVYTACVCSSLTHSSCVLSFPCTVCPAEHTVYTTYYVCVFQCCLCTYTL